jgi:hypothetical protein
MYVRHGTKCARAPRSAYGLRRIPKRRSSQNSSSTHFGEYGEEELGPRLLRPGPSLVAVSDRAGTLRSVYGRVATGNAVVARAAEEGAGVGADSVVALFAG